MSKVSKTARASMAQTVGEKKVIPDDVYIKNLRYDVNNNIHATQEGAKALLRAYDLALAEINQLTEKLSGAESALNDKTIENEGQYKEILAAKEVIANLEAEITAAQAIFGNKKFAAASGCSDTTGEGGVGHEGPCSHD